MSEKTVVETVYGKYHKFEIIKDTSVFGVKFYIYQDGKPTGGYYSSLADAVQAAKNKG